MIPKCGSQRRRLLLCLLAWAVPCGAEPGAAKPGAPTSGKTEPKAAAQPALQGYCPVSYQLSGKPVKGDPAYASKHEGRLYYFANAEAKKAFDADPGKFVPQFDGVCTTALGGPYANRLACDPEVFDVVDGKLYMFSSQRAKNAYALDPPKYIGSAKERFAMPVLRGACPVAYLKEGKIVKGDPQFRASYLGYMFYPASASAREAFQANPEKYVAQYTKTRLKYIIHCAEGVSRGKLFPADPTVFSVVDGKVYMFWDAEAKTKFDADPTATIAKADTQWPALKDTR